MIVEKGKGIIDETPLKEPETPVLSMEDQRFLEARGYILDLESEKLGEGANNDVLAAMYQQGDVNSMRALRIEKDTPSFPSAIVGREKGYGAQQETAVLNDVTHPNLSYLHDSFTLPSGRRGTATTFLPGAADLEKVISEGPLLEKEVVTIAKKVGAAIEALHSNGKVHRDLKPSNILVAGRGRDVRVGDLEIATEMNSPSRGVMTTKGKTSYAAPRDINSFMGNEETRAEVNSDLRAYGAIIYEMLTGTRLFDYAITDTPQSGDSVKTITFGDSTMNVSLFDGEEPIQKVDLEKDAASLKKKLRKVPKKFRPLIKELCDPHERHNEYSIGFALKKLDTIGLDLPRRFADGVTSGLKVGLATALGVSALGWAVIGGIKETKKEPVPSMRDLWLRKEYREYSLEDKLTKPSLERDYALDILYPYMQEAKERYSELTKKQLDYMDSMEHFGYGVHSIPQRLTAAWLIACKLQEDKARAYSSDKDHRFTPSFVPQGFVRQTRQYYELGDPIDDHEATARGIIYLKQCVDPGEDLADALAKYFSSTREITTARVQTKNLEYLPRIDEKGTVYTGYGAALPRHQRDLINMTLAIHYLTDDKGNVDFSKMPELSKPQGTFSSRLTIPTGPTSIFTR